MVQDEEEGGGGGDFVGQLNKLREEGKKKRIVITNKGITITGETVNQSTMVRCVHTHTHTHTQGMILGGSQEQGHH